MNWLIDLMTINVLLIRALALQAEYVSMCVHRNSCRRTVLSNRSINLLHVVCLHATGGRHSDFGFQGEGPPDPPSYARVSKRDQIGFGGMPCPPITSLALADPVVAGQTE
jgi:hypothetical protein